MIDTMWISYKFWEALTRKEDIRLDQAQGFLSKYGIKDVQFKIYYDYHSDDEVFWIAEPRDAEGKYLMKGGDENGRSSGEAGQVNPDG